jgi:hypothetical protein
MISLAVSRGGRGVGVGRKVMEFCGSIVRALWHGVSPAILDAVVGECSLSDYLSRPAISSVFCLTDQSSKGRCFGDPRGRGAPAAPDHRHGWPSGGLFARSASGVAPGYDSGG